MIKLIIKLPTNNNQQNKITQDMKEQLFFNFTSNVNMSQPCLNLTTIYKG